MRCHIERVVGHREESVALALEDLETSVGYELDLLLQQVDAGEWIAIAAHEQRRALDLREVLGAQLVGEARSMQRIREEHEATEVRFDRGHARDASAERLPSTDH